MCRPGGFPGKAGICSPLEELHHLSFKPFYSPCFFTQAEESVHHLHVLVWLPCVDALTSEMCLQLYMVVYVL